MTAVRPRRVQLSRRTGWRKPEGAVVVARPSRWGNSFRVERSGYGWQVTRRIPPSSVYAFDRTWSTDRAAVVAEAVRLYRLELLRWADDEFDDPSEALASLRGRDLACWCPLDQPCHADVLLELANREPQ